MQVKSAVRKSYGIFFALGMAFSAELLLHTSIQRASFSSSCARGLIVFILLFALHQFAVQSFKYYRPRKRDLATLMLVLIGSLLILCVGSLVGISVAAYLESHQHISHLSPESFFYGIPLCTGALLLQAVLGIHYSFVFGLSLALIVGIYFPENHLLPPYVLVTRMIACLSLRKFRSRSDYLRAGLNVSIIAFCFALCAIVMHTITNPTEVAVSLISAFGGGILSCFLAAGVIPAIEYLGGYVTDLRLIEMATLDHPLLKDLSIQAPGTWNHSMVMGMMVEAAADAVGANPILARVGAYFHDIGKTKKPLYFVENQGGEENRHDKLSPSMSALIIRSHVKDGIEMAREHGVPKPIEDMIPQHHGTYLIEYFYDKACKEAEGQANSEETPHVDESLYTYPGPKPQTREAGILMLADGIEAAARTLSEPGLDRIQGMVQKMINKVFASGQLDECDLTLQDLHLIAKCFTRVLNGIYHQRIAYAEPAEKMHEKPNEEEVSNKAPHPSSEDEKLAGATASKKQKGEAADKAGKNDSKEDLKRLGL